MLFASSLAQVSPVDRTSYVALDVIVMPMMLAAAMRSTLIAYLSASAIGRWLGAVSYSVYLWHFPVIAIFSIGIYLLAIDRLTNMTEIFFLYAATVLVVAHMSYRWFEWPARRWVIRRFDAVRPSRADESAVRPAREVIK